MIVCRNCGHQIEDGAAFCDTCNAFLEWSGEQVATADPGPVTPRALPTEHARHPGPESAPSSEAVLTTLSSGVQTVEPGHQAAFTLEIRNPGSTVDRLTIEVLGVAAAWAEVDPPVLNLMPGTAGTATIRMLPPRTAAVRAGEVSFGIGIRSADHPAASVVERGVIRITPFSEFEVDLAPRVAAGRRGGSFAVRATNHGNVPISLALAGNDPENVLGFRFVPSTLFVEPGNTALASVAVAATSTFVVGAARARPFQVTATPGNEPRRTLEGTFRQAAVLPAWVLTALALGIAACALIVVAHPFDPKPSPPPSSRAPATASGLTNGGFDTGAWNPWIRRPDDGTYIHITSDDGGFQAITPCCYARVDSGTGTDAWTEFSQAFEASAGDAISGYSFFRTDESRIANNDVGQVIILTSAGELVATPFHTDVASVGASGRTEWTAWSHTFTAAGTYQVVAEVKNVGDNLGTSIIGLDAVMLTRGP
jgi:hypothetical protein